MKRLVLLLGFALAAPGLAAADCPPPGAMLRMIREATGVGLVRLGSRAARTTSPLERGANRFIGFDRLETYELPAAAQAAIARAFGGPAAYECELPSIGHNRSIRLPVQVGFELTSRRGTIQLVLLEPDQRVEMELASGSYATAPLSTEGAAAWRRALAEILGETGRGPVEFYEQMRADGDSLPPMEVAERGAVGTQEEYPEFALQPRVRVAPHYPQMAREAGVDGTVMVRALVGPDGRVKETRVVKSVPMLDAAAVEVVRQWEFLPWIRDGQPITAWTVVPVRFSLH